MNVDTLLWRPYIILDVPFGMLIYANILEDKPLLDINLLAMLRC
jgi:hypothetical protein